MLSLSGQCNGFNAKNYIALLFYESFSEWVSVAELE